MKILYIFPHPDDESFGPGPTIAKQIEQGHDVHLLTLTKGEATKMRFDLGYDKKQMGEVRAKEMECVEKVLGLSSMTIWDFEDSAVSSEDKKLAEKTEKFIRSLDPEIIVTYPSHGISGFEDHKEGHKLIVNIYNKLKDQDNLSLKRLAFICIDQAKLDAVSEITHLNLNVSSSEDIDCIFPIEPKFEQKGQEALDCYKTYVKVIDQTGIRKILGGYYPFEIYDESFDPPLDDLTKDLK